MEVFISLESKKRIYHMKGCPYAVRMLPRNRKLVGLNRITRKGYCSCRYCFSEKGRGTIQQRLLEESVFGRRMDCWYAAQTDTYYLRTEMGFWKFYWKEQAGGYLLFHLNEFDPALSNEELVHRKFHRQSDVEAATGMKRILDYVEAHDKAMKKIAIDYRQLPTRTKKQRGYYKKAKDRVRRHNIKRVYDLFDLIAKNADNSTILAY